MKKRIPFLTYCILLTLIVLSLGTSSTREESDELSEDSHSVTTIKTEGEYSLLEEYYDEKREPAPQTIGHCALYHEYDEDGYEIRLTYLDKDGRPIRIRYGYATIEKTYDEEGRLETERYFGTDGNPTASFTNAYGLRREYNEKGQNIVIQYFDMQDRPVISVYGYAYLHRTYYNSGDWEGKVELETYGDEQDNPISLSLGQYGVWKREYDSNGWACIQTYLGRDGQPMLTNLGYSTVKQTLYENGSPHTTFYYDLNGNPVRLSEGQYGVLNENGKTYYLDINGKKIFNLHQFLIGSEWSVILMCAIAVLFSAFASRKLNILLLPVYTIFILYMTILTRNPGSAKPNLDFLWSYRQLFVDNTIRWEIANNILLFMPAGAMLFRIFPRKRVLIVAILLSIVIEAVQFVTGRGVCELDDVVSNAIGAGGGLWVTRSMLKYVIADSGQKAEKKGHLPH